MTAGNVVVWGLGRETRAYLDYLTRIRWDGRILLFDDTETPIVYGSATDELPFCLETVTDVSAALNRVDLLVRSPGVSPYRPEIQHFVHGGGKVTTPTAIAVEALRGQGLTIVGVTGTNGKSSTCTILKAIFEAADQPCILAGNIGVPLVDYVASESDLENHIFVLELSSYQIFDLSVSPSYIIFLNLFVDHVEWHKTVENYRRDKLSILAIPNVEHAIVHPDVLSQLPSVESHVSSYSVPSKADHEAQCLQIGSMDINVAGCEAAASEHMFQNASAAATMAAHMGLPKDVIEKGLKLFKGLDHRLKAIENAGGVTFVDDSISTTPEAVLAALKSFKDRRIHLILGGYDRGLDYASLLGALPNYDLVSLILIGDVGARLGKTPQIKSLSSASVSIVNTKNLSGALDDLELVKGDLVLLSPGASSFDSYRDYIHRGEAFASEVKRVTGKLSK